MKISYVVRVMGIVLIAVALMTSFFMSAIADDGEDCTDCTTRRPVEPGSNPVELPSPLVMSTSSAPGYCDSVGGSHIYEYILDVDYTQMTEDTMAITVEIYIANPTGCTSGDPCPEYDESPEYINGWIDWDGDQVFDSDERVLDVALTGYLGINYYGTMSTSTIVTIPESVAGNLTWMRVNLGWDHDPNDPCEYSWTWGDIVDRLVAIGMEVPQIDEIIVTGIPDANNPTTSDASNPGVEEVRLEAVITEAEGFEVINVSWSGDVPAGSGNPYEYIAAAGTHGMKYVVCAITYEEESTGDSWTDSRGRNSKLFFVKEGNDDGDSEPNWFEYWESDDAIPDMSVANYNPALTAYGRWASGHVELGPNSAGQHYSSAIELDTHFGHESFGGPAVKGIDCAAEVIAHELYHKWVDDQWQSGGEFYGKTDSDYHLEANDCDDELPDDYETNTSHTENDTTDTYDLEHEKHSQYRRYGDQEYMAMRAGDGARGTPERDWANPGKQSNPPYGCHSLGDYIPVGAEFTGVFSDTGLDTDSDGFYNYLNVLAQINVTTGGPFNILAKLYDTDTNEITFVNESFILNTGVQWVALDFDGLAIREHGVNGPYTVSVYLDDDFGDEIDHRDSVYATNSYDFNEFEQKDASFTDVYTDYGLDTNGNGLYDELVIGAQLDVLTPGAYTAEAALYDADGNAIDLVAESISLGSGVQMVEFSFDGKAISRNRVNGPYYLKYLSLSGSPLVDFVKDAHITSPYILANFEKADAMFDGYFSDYGQDTDSDGLYNYLVVEMGIDVTAAGDFTVIGWLYDTEGPIVMASAAGPLASGSQVMALNFEGTSIYLNGVDGPYNVKYISLYDENGILMDTVNNAHTTGLYSFNDFQEPLVGLTGNCWDYGTDTDMDGKFDYLTIDIEVLLRDPGYCLVKARLVDMGGGEMIWAQNIAELDSATPQIIQLNFDGDAIFQHGVNGPYYLKDVYIFHTGDPFQPYYVHEAYTTGMYFYCQFGSCPPVADANGPYTGVEGIPVTFDASGSYDPDGIIVLYEWDFDGDGTYDTSSTAPTATFIWGDDYMGEASLRVTDDEGFNSTDSAPVEIINVAPTINIVSMIQPNSQFILPVVHELTFEATATDLGSDDLTFTWDWGDTISETSPTYYNNGVSPDPHPSPVGIYPFSATDTVTHVYSEPGEYTVTVTVTDDDSGLMNTTLTLIVVDVAEAKHITNAYIQGLDDAFFKRNAMQRRAAFDNMFSALDDMLEDEEYNGMIQHLQNNIRSKADGWIDGKLANDWIIDQDAQGEICQKIDDIMAYLEYVISIVS